MKAPTFYYDFQSPYAYLAALRIDRILEATSEWRPIAFGVIVRRTGKVPWSFGPDRSAHFNEIERRAADRGVPALKYPPGWPVETYSLTPLRAALLATDQDRLREISLALYRTIFVEGRELAELDAVLDAAERAGMDREAVRAGIESPAIKDQLRSQTDEAFESGVRGVPTVVVDDQLFWGDDRLEDAAAALGP